MFMGVVAPLFCPMSDHATIIYRAVRAASTALRAHGCEDERLYAYHRDMLAEWAGRTRGNLLKLMRLVVGTISESDRLRGSHNGQGRLRFRAAREAVGALVAHAEIVPAGPADFDVPL